MKSIYYKILKIINAKIYQILNMVEKESTVWRRNTDYHGSAKII